MNIILIALIAIGTAAGVYVIVNLSKMASDMDRDTQKRP